jgi:hypothetical protein
VAAPLTTEMPHSSGVQKSVLEWAVKCSTKPYPLVCE